MPLPRNRKVLGRRISSQRHRNRLTCESNRSWRSCGLDELEGHILVRADDQRMKDEVVAESVYRFKGLERPVVILTDLSCGARKATPSGGPR